MPSLKIASNCSEAAKRSPKETVTPVTAALLCIGALMTRLETSPMVEGSNVQPATLAGERLQVTLPLGQNGDGGCLLCPPCTPRAQPRGARTPPIPPDPPCFSPIEIPAIHLGKARKQTPSPRYGAIERAEIRLGAKKSRREAAQESTGRRQTERTRATRIQMTGSPDHDP